MRISLLKIQLLSETYWFFDKRPGPWAKETIGQSMQVRIKRLKRLGLIQAYETNRGHLYFLTQHKTGAKK